nr:MAG TPA: hypothetical protein [Caudoviricetes sp.]
MRVLFNIITPQLLLYLIRHVDQINKQRRC